MKSLQIFALVAFLGLAIGIAGCAFLNRMLPSQVDESGNIVPGTHTASAEQQAAASLVPYGIGSAVLNILLIVMNGYEKYKVAKIGNGLKSTIAALNQIRDDPALKAEWTQIKTILSDAHSVAGVTPLIKEYIAKV